MIAIPPPRWMAYLVGSLAGLALIMLALTGCPGATATATKAIAATMHAAQTADKGLAAEATAELAGGADKAPVCKRLVAFRDYAHPAARSAVGAAFAAVRIADEAGKKPPDYMSILKPGACALVIALREWGHLLPDKGAQVLGLLNAFSVAACSAPKAKAPGSAVAIVTALLPVAVELVKWVVELVGAPTAALQKEISDWLTTPPPLAVEAVIKARCNP
jgi:hypothetical protein